MLFILKIQIFYYLLILFICVLVFILILFYASSTKVITEKTLSMQLYSLVSFRYYINLSIFSWLLTRISSNSLFRRYMFLVFSQMCSTEGENCDNECMSEGKAVLAGKNLLSDVFYWKKTRGIQFCLESEVYFFHLHSSLVPISHIVFSCKSGPLGKKDFILRCILGFFVCYVIS